MKYLSKISLLTFLLLIYLFASPQQFQYFNNRYDLNGLYNIDRSYNIIEANDGYVIAGNSIVISGNIYWWEKVLAKINFEGQIQIVKYYEEDSVDYFFDPFPGFMIKDNNHFYTVGKRRTPTSNWVHDEGTLMCLNENLDTLWSKRFGEKTEPFDTAYLFTCIQKVDQDNLVIAGGWKPYGLATHVYLIKTDSLGQLIWDKSYSYYGYYIEGYSVIQTTDQGFAIGCFKQTPGYTNTVDPVIIKTDYLGNQEWTKNLGGQYMDNSAMVCISKDSMIVVGTNYADSMLTPDISLSRINIVKIDNLGNIIWNKKYGASKTNNYLLNIRVLNDGFIIAVGSLYQFDPATEWIGWILKTNSNGDSLWYREYKLIPGEESLNYLYDIIPTTDNGFIACGYIDPSSPDTGSIDTWIIKLDSIGCDTAGCDPTVGIDEEKEKGGRGKEESMVVWPNPAGSIIWFVVPSSQFAVNNQQSKRNDIFIYDIFGRLIEEMEIPPGKDEIQLDISGYHSGIYFVVVRNKTDVIGSAKFLVVH